ncbi:PF01863 domain protein, partial [Schaalia georgiae F0490]
MRREEARALARALMDDAGLGQWGLRFDRAKRRAGSCTHATRTISLSGPLTDIYDEATVRAVVLHEIAHALVGPSQGHGARWREAARALGAPDSATLPGALPAPDAP